jgi:DNA invertase Pin-like site-specific DNA recombinase
MPATSPTPWLKKGGKLALNAVVYDLSDPMGKIFFNILATFTEFEVDLIRMRPARAWRSPEP